MIVTCTNCEKKYTVDEKSFKKNTVQFKCKACNTVFTVEKPVLSYESVEYSEDISVSMEKEGKDRIKFGLYHKSILLMLLISLAPITSLDTDEQTTTLRTIHEQYPWMYLVFTLDKNGMNTARNFTIGIVTIIAWFSARAIRRPILEMSDAATRMSLGDFDVQININSKDEIGMLAKSIIRMQTSLAYAMKRLDKT